MIIVAPPDFLSRKTQQENDHGQIPFRLDSRCSGGGVNHHLLNHALVERRPNNRSPRHKAVDFLAEKKTAHSAPSLTPIEETAMNKDQIKGVAKDIVGKIQEDAGKLMGSK